ncbi:GAF domain-containing protein [Microbacterium oryzae]|uniref:GAF domain-containing sensor histidine kinase n=1 Tax=Microbacterium oryzae TaxID=743009 RepID=UPI0025B0B7D4|nr:GAF domain-containing protein [Microbacterium oryzae]MDN3311138.1 GAF domain-containing protein [Microbacterium oryzae]
MSGDLDFIDQPRSELERSLSELMQHAQHVLQTESRLRGLLQAYRSVMESLDIDDVLRRIAGAAVSLIDAREGAIAVFDEHGGVERVLGRDSESELVATLQRGDLAPLAWIERDPRHAGVPLGDGGAFLAVPVRSHGDAYGALYLLARGECSFSREDEELVTALAGTAGIALENARLYEESRRRVRWSAALAEVSSALLSEDVSDSIGVVAARVGTVVSADLVSVVIPDPDSDQLLIHTARGAGAERFEGRRYEREASLVDRSLRGGQVILATASTASVSVEAEMGPTMALPVVVTGEAVCALTLSRAAGSTAFTALDADMAAEFATQVGISIELTRARADRHRLELADERGRIARDLHDHVIQRLFGTGLSLQALAARFPRAETDLLEQVDTIDAAIGEIRTAVFALTARPRAATGTTRHRILDVVGELADALPSSPQLTFRGPIDLLLTGAVADDAVAAVRECLANVARHAQAGSVSVDVAAEGDEVRVEVVDDGIGVPADATRSSGTGNLEDRARRRGGDFALTPRDGGGTRAVWRALLSGERGRA